ncbi:TrmH family RNA methyltransferase [Streptomyces sp. NBC_01803]|uniref:TrmH family RNA methyltransferase n=1 Tax=Streptomyces sp. NBC_01803 TaxID=2975946 RepID=UPI002DDC4DDB|nr:TrmH family RNA methyltransferase [Streptomyces sp. NBC_01803]WSA45240.1 TrmH family RNA methyltransferase [Streptomyces sp. NBC_01803]
MTDGRWRELAPRAVLLDGFHALKHALRFGAEIPLAVAADKAAALDLARRLAPDLTEPLAALLTETGVDGLRRVVPRPHPTGVAALAVPAPRPPAATGRTAPVVLLDNPRHLGNIGAVIRLAAGMAAAGVITTGTADPWHPTVLRAAAGLHFALPVSRADLASPPTGPLYALDPAGRDIAAVRPAPGAVLAFGSERAGLSDEVKARAAELISLPMRPGVSSYNLATSVAMTLYHWRAGAVAG